MGVPQGSVLSVIFALKIDSIVTEISHYCERHLQRSLNMNMLSHWADTIGFKFSSSKTVCVCVHFCRLRSAHLNGTLTPFVEETKFLEVIFDNKLNIHSTHSLPQRKVCEGAQPSAWCCSHFLGSRTADAVTSFYIFIDRLLVLF